MAPPRGSARVAARDPDAHLREAHRRGAQGTEEEEGFGMSQEMRLAALLRERWVSPLDALEFAGCLRLGARIYDLRRAGVAVAERWRTENGKRFKEFRIAP